MTRVLFVDDDERVLDGLRRMLRMSHDGWELAFADSGPAALAALAEEPADVVVSDMRMPGMDGVALLTEIRHRHPGTIRIILSGHTELEAAYRSIPVAHQFLSKPCDPAVLRLAVSRASALQSRLRAPELQEMLGRIDALPSPPQSLVALNAMLADRHTGVGAIAGVIERDVAMAAKVLQLVNSAFFGLPRAITDLRQAVSYLGFVNLRNVVAMAGVFRAFPAEGQVAHLMAEVETHSACTAAVARELFAGVLDPPTLEELTVGALLHDVGMLVLAAGIPDAIGALLDEGPAGPDRCRAERERFGADHATVGASLLAVWGLPIPIVEAVAWHHEAESLPDPRLDAVHATHVADILASGDGPLDPAYVETLGITDLVAEWRAGHPGPRG